MTVKQQTIFMKKGAQLKLSATASANLKVLIKNISILWNSHVLQPSPALWW